MSSLGFVNVPADSTGRMKTIRYDAFVALLFKQESFRHMVDHARAGCCEEAGELSDGLKKHIVYGRDFDRDNLLEELGGMRFYMQAIMNLFGVSEQEVLQYNADQLAKRYVGLEYSNASAQARADKTGE